MSKKLTRSALHRETVTKEDVDPKSILGRAIVKKDSSTIKQIERASFEDRMYRRSMEDWTADDFQTWYYLTASPKDDSLEEQEENDE